ncbi:Rec8 like protein-domain-containing protein [Gloeopeniophorella convolvens]|nr:Rec8 like protein-domain-containing protein [Gloeopeniophorella convolvens]
MGSPLTRTDSRTEGACGLEDLRRSAATGRRLDCFGSPSHISWLRWGIGWHQIVAAGTPVICPTRSSTQQSLKYLLSCPCLVSPFSLSLYSLFFLLVGMFFTPELLSRRDSGFGLLWLAATLGAKSSFKKLPKRDVMGADIAQLCDLITEPAEPLALRLSSNLMVGVARVYKVKHDIFLGDVNACFIALKKAVQDLRAFSAASTSLQMGHPTVRSDTVTVPLDPAVALGLNLDDFLGDWQDILDAQEDDGSDDEYGKPKKRPKARDAKTLPPAEAGRKATYTLDESLEHMLSGSFDVSFLSAHHGEQALLASSQINDDFGFGDGEGFDLGDIGDELAKELGDGWTSAPAQPRPSADADEQPVAFPDQEDFNMDLGQGDDFAFASLDQPPGDSSSVVDDVQAPRPLAGEKRTFEAMNNDMSPPVATPPQSQLVRSPSPPSATGTEVAGVENIPGEVGVVAENHPVQSEEARPKRVKRVRIQLDARTELTDDELKAARAQYVEGQEALRRSLEERRLEKEGARLVEEMLYGVPFILSAPTLVDFWIDNFKVLVEARSHAGQIKTPGDLPTKARQLSEPLEEVEYIFPQHDDVVMDQAIDVQLLDNVELDDFDFGRQRSSEEPGQARHASVASFPTGSAFDLGRNLEIASGSQKSSMFPWDNAGLSSSVAGAPFDIASEKISAGNEDLRLKDNRSAGRSSGRGSSLVPSQLNSGPGTAGFSPRAFGGVGTQVNESFEFEVPEDNVQGDAEAPEPNPVTLERNSFNFLEYVKMQLQAVQDSAEGLAFDKLAPQETSTSHVAAAAFYHCLVLSTKGLLRVNQPVAYGELKIRLT